MAAKVSQVKKTKGLINMYESSNNTKESLTSTMQLFGMPFQFLDTCDQRIPGVSNSIGRKYIENILTDAPILTIIPGKPKYLPGAKDKTSVTNAFIDASNGNFSPIKKLISSATEEDLKLYDFQPAFVDYYQYVNILCRSCAGFLDLGANTGYKINGKDVNFKSFDWKNYRWNGKPYKSTTTSVVVKAATSVGKSLGNFIKSVTDGAKSAKKEAEAFLDGISSEKTTSNGIDFYDTDSNIDPDLLDASETALQRKNFIQFYVDPDSASMSYGVNNNTQQSTFKQGLDSATGSVREIAYLADSGGVDSESLQQLGDKALTELSNGLGGALSSVNESAGSIVSRLLSSGKAIIRGENIMMPDIWSGCDMSQSHTITAHYKAPYGNKLCFYNECLVPMMHWVALAYPRATTANSYGSPFLVKAYMSGSWTINLGCITGLEIKMDVTDGNVNTDGLYTEIDVTATITDLYSDMAMTPANNPMLFLNNSSLVNFLGTTCGLNLINSQLKEKASMIWNNTISNIKDTPSNVMNNITQSIDNIIMSFVGL